MSKKQTKDQKIAELTNSLQRLQAEFENYKRRVDKEKEEQNKYASAEIIKKFLSIKDLFDLAIKNSEDKDKFKKGMELIYSEFSNILKNEGLQKIEAENKQLNPHLHDAMMAVESDKPKDTIIEVLQEGYMLKDKVLRHSKVKISR